MIYKSGIIASGSGSIGGLTFSHNRAGQYIRARSIPTDPASSEQQSARTRFSNASARWATLSTSQRDAWKTYALAVPIVNPLGDPVYLTGQQMYVRCNSARLAGGLTYVDDGPTVYSADSLSAVSIAASQTGLALSITFSEDDDWVDEDDAALLIFASRQQSPTTNWFRGPYRFAGSVDGDSTTAPTSPAADTSPFLINTGNYQYYRVFSVRADGRLSPVQYVGPTAIGA
jgi:hypothetical protein